MVWCICPVVYCKKRMKVNRQIVVFYWLANLQKENDVPLAGRIFHSLYQWSNGQHLFWFNWWLVCPVVHCKKDEGQYWRIVVLFPSPEASKRMCLLLGRIFHRCTIWSNEKHLFWFNRWLFVLMSIVKREWRSIDE